MPQIKVKRRDGTAETINAVSGRTLMETLREHGFDEILAICGGCCSCATCHIHLSPTWLSKIGPPVNLEDDLLDSSDYREDGSRLSCQITVTEELDGLELRIPPPDL